MEYWHSLPYSIYCLVMARYCPLPGQLCAIARHKTIRREFFIKAPLFFLLFTRTNFLDTNTYAIFVKSEEYF